LSDGCYDVIYPEDYAKASNSIEELFIFRRFDGNASAQVLEIFKKGKLQLQLDLMNEECKFLGEYQKYEQEFGDIQAIFEKDEKKLNDDVEDRTEAHVLLSKIYPELNYLIKSSLDGFFAGLFDIAKTFHVANSSDSAVKVDEYLTGFEEHEIEYGGDTLFSWGG